MGQLKRLQQQLIQMQMDQLRQLNQPNPYLEQLMGLNKSIIDWHTNSTPGGIKDIYKHPTLASKLPVFELAKTNRDKGRIGRGIASVGEHFRPQYAKELQQEDDYNRSIAASGMLEMGLRDELNNAEGNLRDLVMSDTQRRTAGNGNFNSAFDALDRMRAQSFSWGGFLRGMIPGLATMGGAAAIGAATPGLSIGSALGAL